MRGVKVKLPSGVWAMLVAAGELTILLLGLWAGWAIAGGYYKPEIARLNNELDATQEASLASASETKFWQSTLKRLSEGEQIDGKDIKRPKPEAED